MVLKYTTVKQFWEYLGINESTYDFMPNQNPGRELVASPTVAAGTYYLSHMGVNPDTLVLYANNTVLTLTTHYTFDATTSAVTITSDGATALSGSSLYAVYEFCALGKHLNYAVTTALLERAESNMEQRIGGVFADQSSSTPQYKQITSESKTGSGATNNLYSLMWGPVVKLQTTVASNYTTGGSSLVLTDASGFPSSGTIYVDGNIVTYTARSSNTLTVPTSTPTTASGAVVRGEVVQVSTSPGGVVPTFNVLTPDSDYSIDYDTGQIQLLDNYYFLEDTWLDKPGDGLQDRVRVSYMHAWHQVGQQATIPDEIVELVHMIAARKLAQRTILRSIISQRDNFNPQTFGVSEIDINRVVDNYMIVRVRNV